MAHALFSPSSAHRWMACPASAKINAQAEDTPSPYAIEGTTAHELAEICLRQDLIPAHLPTDDDWAKYPAEMRDHVQTYLDIVLSERIHMDGRLLVEQRVDFSGYVPDGKGTADAVIVGNGELLVIDLKYGQGVRVDAKDNQQLRLYALGAYEQHWMDLGDDPKIRMMVVQPRLDHISWDSISVSTLIEFGEQAGRAAKAGLRDNAPFAPGDHCRWCAAAPTCRARMEQALDIAEYEFGGCEDPIPPEQLTMAEIADLLPHLDKLKDWATDVQAYALQRAMNGADVPGYKLVEGRSVRKWKADAEALLADRDDVWERKLIGITKAQKVLGKAQINEYLEKPPGKPTLVSEGDRRPAVQGTKSAQADFS